ncbi:putative dimethylaniline monooxygenase [Clohesyomyces aquaticus]|uniref:L-ornithine N(5)-monooxygenase [NAD(P)H] n=1 Tax=Clohesyomyces aquaticus TaxID=1231657 RepID=A0A1Y1Z1U0_9PLEO|nr:putative dimethylaniline monooxygenase [Clohesyomyces aquaticus]
MGAENDLIVVGAGWFGLAAAKSYIELHPGESVLVIDAASTFGGTWSADRLYPGLKSNNLWGSYEYPDFRMSEEVYGVEEGQHIPAAVLHQYLTDFAKHFGVFERTRLNTKVDEVEPSSTGGGLVKIIGGNGETETIETKKLVLACGLTSQPNIPEYEGADKFEPSFFHAKDFCKRADTVGSSKNVVVVGGGKSGYDICYAYATEGNATVDLIIRPNGQGPVWLAQPYVTPFKRKMEEFLHTRSLTWFSPCAWGDEDGFAIPRGFLHRTGMGRLLTDNYWNHMVNDLTEANGYDDHPEVFKLKPWNPVFWTGSGIGIHNFETNFFDLVKEGKIRVHIVDVAKLDGRTVHLTDGERLETDVMICATGWRKDSPVKFKSFGEGGVWLPYSATERSTLVGKANKEVLEMFPSLKRQLVLRYQRKDEEPKRMYRFIVPPTSVKQRNLAFAGMVSTTSTALFASTQGLWISAFFDGKLSRIARTEQEVAQEIMLHTQWGKWRYPCGYGDSIPDFAFESLPYVDLLLNEIGIWNHRKRNQIAELFEPYKPWDYIGLAQEYTELHSDKSTNSKKVA